MKIKDKIRNEILEKRKRMSLNEVNVLSKNITNNFKSDFFSYSTYLLYSSFGNEVDTSRLINSLQKEGKSVFLPILRSDGLLGIGEFVSENDLVKNRFGIFEPSTAVNVKNFDIVVVPGVAFDKNCDRLGFGKGYYDRLLTEIKTKLKIGLSYDLQIVDELPSEVHDIPMDIVLTETKIYRRN